MTVPRFDYFAPESVDEACRLLNENGKKACLLAGGTDLMVRINQGLTNPSVVIGLKKIAGLHRIVFDNRKGLIIGATALLSDVASHPAVRKIYPAIAYAASQTANVQIRNMGTVAGNICNAAPSADNAPTLLALDAKVFLASTKGERQLPLDQFFLGPSVTATKPDEVLTSIFVPIPSPNSGASYQHISARGKVDISAVGIGVAVTMDGQVCKDVRIFMGAVGPIPLRAVQAEKIVKGKKLSAELIEEAGAQASREARPITDVRASAQYRRRMVAVLTRRALVEAQTRAGRR